MHRFLRSVGFSSLSNRKDLQKLCDSIIQEPDARSQIRTPEGIWKIQYEKEVSYGIGVALRGEVDEEGQFRMDHYFPFYRSDLITATEEIVVNKRIDTDAYTGMCEDMRLGVSLIFYLQNALEYQKSLGETSGEESFIAPVTISALAAEGKILLGVAETVKDSITKEKEGRRNQLLSEARAGDAEAMDSLTLDDIDLFAKVMKRSQKEDIYSIVNTAFVPFGSESDNYSVIGTILDCDRVKNRMTQETLYVMRISCNDLEFPLCINAKDLYGEPREGRRFKGTLWLQGTVDFQE